MSVSAEHIQAIRDRLDIVTVVGARVKLRKRGDTHYGLCPFHHEKTPSFTVQAQKGLFYCFGCHAGGDIFSFVMRFEGLDFPGAARALAQQAGVAIAPETPEVLAQKQRDADVAHVNGCALQFFQQALLADSADVARQYMGRRGITRQTAQNFQLGYGGAPGQLISYLAQQQITPQQAIQAGLVTEDGARSLFDERLIFPIIDTLNRVAGFGGRRLFENSTPKYVNSRESPLFSKRRLLYGWEHAQEAIRQTRRVVLVEGYTDVLACHMADCPQAVAALGTALTLEHAQQCERLAKEAVLFLDGDAAGLRATREAAEKFIAVHMKTLVAPLPPGDDPDSLVRKHGPQALTACIENARPALEYFMEQAFASPTMAIEDRVRAAEDFGSLLVALGSGLERDLYSARLAERVGVTVAQLERHLKLKGSGFHPGLVHHSRSSGSASQSFGSSSSSELTMQEMPQDGQKPANAPVPAEIPPPPLDTTELTMLRDLLLYPELRPRFVELGEFSINDATRALWDALATSDATVSDVIGKHVRDASWVKRLVDVRPVATDEEYAAERSMQTFMDVLTRLKVRHLDRALKDVVREIQEVESKGGATDVLMTRKMDLSRKKIALKQRGAVSSDHNSDRAGR